MSSFLDSRNLYNKLPDFTIKNERTTKFVKWVGEKISSPENRLILGASALIAQPYIDMHNKNVDEDTRKISALRTCAKIIAGTVTGVAIRAGSIKAVRYFTKIGGEYPQNIFVPSDNILKKLGNNLNHYAKAYGSILALGVMLFTNFLIDAPLTKFLTNKFIDAKNKKENKKC